MFHRRSGMPVAALRFSFVARPDEVREVAARVRRNPAGNPRTLWSYVDIRDAAPATRRALEVDGLTFEVFNITAPDTLSDTPPEELLREFAPLVETRQAIPAVAPPYSIQKAKRMLRYQPPHPCRHPRAPP